MTLAIAGTLILAPTAFVNIAMDRSVLQPL